MSLLLNPNLDLFFVTISPRCSCMHFDPTHLYDKSYLDFICLIKVMKKRRPTWMGHILKHELIHTILEGSVEGSSARSSLREGIHQPVYGGHGLPKQLAIITQYGESCLVIGNFRERFYSRSSFRARYNSTFVCRQKSIFIRHDANIYRAMTHWLFSPVFRA